MKLQEVIDRIEYTITRKLEYQQRLNPSDTAEGIVIDVVTINIAELQNIKSDLLQVTCE
jgi:hypothetical protein